ncbi:MAG: Gfo/Idh/MocA family oxidoreductase [Firmicutes bacterium]|nr:Gfo/Idh/MocA family oxidoreductase [Bacillota bacterium]
MRRPLRVGVVGAGFVGERHIDAIRRIGLAELTAIVDSDYSLALTRSAEHRVPKCGVALDEILDDVDVIHNCTPNNMHMAINVSAIRAGKHVFSEKPLALDTKESQAMLDCLRRNPKIVHGVNFNYRMNSMVREMKQKVAAGEIGDVMLVHGAYLQDWLMFDTDYNWRLEPSVGGPMRAIADIGSHWIDAVQTVVGSRVTEVCADLATLIPIRKKRLGHRGATFSKGCGEEFQLHRISTEDYGAVLFRMANGAKGVFYVSQVSAGRKNDLFFQIDGTKSSLYWSQERPDEIRIGNRDSASLLMMRAPDQLSAEAAHYTRLPAGHPEGWNDTLLNSIREFYKFVVDGKTVGVDRCDFATFEDGHQVMQVAEAILRSSTVRGWVRVGDEAGRLVQRVPLLRMDEAAPTWAQQLWKHETGLTRYMTTAVRFEEVFAE